MSKNARAACAGAGDATAALSVNPQAAAAMAERQPREILNRKEVVSRQQERRNMGRRQRDEIDPMDPVRLSLYLLHLFSTATLSLQIEQPTAAYSRQNPNLV